MSRRVVITGTGPVSGLGIGLEANWQAICAGRSAIRRIDAFDPSGFECQIGAMVEGLRVSKIVPRFYRKATKVMARDIELAVAAADAAARDAGLVTPGTAPESAANNGFEPSYDPARVACHIGAGLIAAELDELTAALVEARPTERPNGKFELHRWGREGMGHLTPLWLLKYLPNMLACHVTIIHDTQGPSNTITCGEASSGLSIGESLRVIQRGMADLGFCGGAESKLNPMAFLRQQLTGRLTAAHNDDPGGALRPFDQAASGTAIGEGGGIVILEALETARQRSGVHPYAEVVGFAASQSVNRATRNREPTSGDPSFAAAIRKALAESSVEPDAISLIIPFGSGIRSWDTTEAHSFRAVFGGRLAEIPIVAVKAHVGNCGAGAGALETVIAAMALREQTVPAIINRLDPLENIGGGSDRAKRADLGYAMVFSSGYGGQNTALILKRWEE